MAEPSQEEILAQQKEQCPFCKIVKGEIPSNKVYEDDLLIAIADIYPSRPGHILLLPKEHYPIMPLIPQDTFIELFKKAKMLSKSMSEGLLAFGSTIFIANGGPAGQQSTHFMIHIVPRDEGDGLNNFNIPDNPVTKEEMEKVYPSLSNNLKIMMQNHQARMGGGAAAQPAEGQMPQTITKDQILKIIEANPQLKQFILEKPEEFKKAIPSTPQLQQLFKDVDVNEIIALVRGEKYEKKEETKEEAKEEEKEEKSEDQDEKESDEEAVKNELSGESDEDKDEEESEEEKTEQENESDETEEDENVNMDDIANLFK
ncbi:HIT family protein [Nanoarchaeota archaeon]